QASPRAGLEVGVPRVARPQPPRTRGAQYSFRPQALRAASRAPEPVAAANLRVLPHREAQTERQRLRCSDEQATYRLRLEWWPRRPAKHDAEVPRPRCPLW